MCPSKLLRTYSFSVVVLLFCCILNEKCEARTYRRRYNPDIVESVTENGDLNSRRYMGVGDSELEYPGSLISDQVRDSLRLPKNLSGHVRVRVESSESESQGPRKHIPGLRRRRRLRPKNDGNGNGDGDKGKPTRRRMPNMTRRMRSSAENENINPDLGVPNGGSGELDLKVIPHPSFTNNGEPIPIRSTYQRLSEDSDDQENVSKSVMVNLKPVKKYYPVFRKSKSTTTTSNPISESEKIDTARDPVPENILIKKPTTKTKFNYRVTSKLNPQLFSLRTVPDLETHESINPFLDGTAGSSVSISNDLSGKNLHSLHSLLNPDSVSVLSEPVIPTTDVPEITTATTATTDLSPKPTMPDDLMMSDEIITTTQNSGSDESPSTVRYRKRLMVGSTLTGSQEFLQLHGLGLKALKKCNDPPMVSVPDNFPSSTTTRNSKSKNTAVSLQESESIKSPATDLPIETTTATEATTTITTTSATERAEVSESSAPTPVTFSNLSDWLDNIVVTLENSPPTSISPQVPISSTSTNQESTTATQETRPTTDPTTQQTTASVSDETVKVQRQIPISSSNNAIEHWSTPAPNPFDLGRILNQYLTTPSPAAVSTPNPDTPLLNGLIDSLNSISNFLDPLAASPPTNILTTQRPLIPNIFGGGGGAPTQASLSGALSNMINVLTNPFSEFGKVNNVNGGPVSNLLNGLTITTPKPIVPLNPTEYLSQLLQLGSDLGIAQDLAKKETPRHASPSITVPAPPVSTPRPFLQFLTPTQAPLFDFSRLLSGNWLSGGGLFAATTPAPSINLFSLLSGLNPFAALLTTSKPANLGLGSLFSGSATNQQQSIFAQPPKQQQQQELQAEKKSGPYFWFDMNTFIPGQDPKTSPTTGIRPKLGDRDYFFRVR